MNKLLEIWVLGLNKRIWVFGILSLPVYAGGMGDICETSDVTTPCLQDSWGVEAHALLLEASSVALEVPQKVTSSLGAVEYGTVPSWQWGFQVGGTYIWNTRNDFNWSWSNYRNDHINRNILNPVNLGTIVQDQIFSFPAYNNFANVTIDVAEFKTTYEWDQINFEWGQQMDLPLRVKMRPQAGVQIARIANYLNRTYGTTTSQGSSLFTSRASTMFNGLGPRSGLELRWESDWGLSVYGRGNLGLIYGPGKNNEFVVNIYDNITTIYNTSIARIVPTFDSQLGAECQFDVAQGILSLDLGWQWNAYQGALVENSFNIQGLFFGLKWLGTLA